jgi:hypothetical protein
MNLVDIINLIESYTFPSIPITISKKSNELPPKNPCLKGSKGDV